MACYTGDGRFPHLTGVGVTIVSTDKYRIIGEVGAGGMGIVYRAVQTRLDRHVAIKVLKPRYSRDPSFVQRFRQEARALAALPHTHIVQIYDIERVGDDLWIIMEWVEGRTLRDVLKAEGPLPWERMRPLLQQCVAALGTAHAAGIVHRDVKPENILFTATDTVKVMDFGVATFLDPDRNEAEDTDTGMGSPRYMAPEQLQGLPCDARVDQYALALVAFEMCVGEFPFPGTDVYAIGYEKLHREPMRLRDFWEGAPPALDDGLARALSRDPADRFPGLAEMLAAIDPPPPKPLPLTPFALGAAAAVALLLTAFYFLRPVEPPPKVIVQEVTVPVEVRVPAPAAPAPVEVAPEPEPEPDPLVPLVVDLDLALVEAEYGTAATLVEEILSHDPEQPRALAAQQQIKLARAQEQLLADAIAVYDAGAIREAKGMFRAVLAAEPDTPVAQDYVARIERQERVDALLSAARDAQADRETTNAKQAYRDLLALEPGNAEATAALREIAAAEAQAARVASAEQALETGELSTARAAFQATLDAEPTNAAASRGLARIAAIERERDRFDASGYATEVRRLAKGLHDGTNALGVAIAQSERTFEDSEVRRTARGARAAVRTYSRTVEPPLEQLARSIDAAGTEVLTFASRTENTSGNLLASIADKQHNQRDRLDRAFQAMDAALAAEGVTLVSGPDRIVDRTRDRLLGSADVEAINPAVLAYRRPVGLLARLGNRETIDPVDALREELKPLHTALNELVAEVERLRRSGSSSVAAELIEQAEGVRATADDALGTALTSLTTSHITRTQQNAERERALGATLTTTLAEARTYATATGEQYRSSLTAWREALAAQGGADEAHFAELDRRLQEVAAQFTQDVSRLQADVGKRLAEQRRLGLETLGTAREERERLVAEARAVSACRSAPDAAEVLGRLSTELAARAEVGGRVYGGVGVEFASAAKAGSERMSAYQRSGAGVLKARLNRLQTDVRRTAAEVAVWEEARADTLRVGTEALRTVGVEVENAVDTWASAVADARARFGNQSRNAFGEMRLEIQRAVRTISDSEAALLTVLAQAEEGKSDPATLLQSGEARLAAIRSDVEAVAAAIATYERRLETAVGPALTARDDATAVLLETLAAHGETLAVAAAAFAQDATARITDVQTTSAAALAESEAGLAEFTAAAAALRLETGEAEPSESS